MQATRRNLLLGTAGAAAFASMGQLSGCSSTTPGTVVPGVIDAITKAITGACSVIPAVGTLVQIITMVFPAAAGVATITNTLAQEIAKYVCNIFKQAGVEHGAANLEGGSFKAVVDTKDVALHGYAVMNGKLVSF